MAGRADSSCINHVTIEAVGRCKQCGKPFCGTCEVVGPTGRFCGEACKTAHETFVERAKQLDDMRGGAGVFGKLLVRLKQLAILLVVLLLGAVAATYFGINVPVIGDSIANLLNR